jgi:hypothetical protein
LTTVLKRLFCNKTRCIDYIGNHEENLQKGMNMKSTIRLVILAVICGAASSICAAALDTIIFGNTSSETAHGISSVNSEAFTGALGQPARRCLPLNPVSYDGGSISFMLKVDPHRQNYLTVKLWGSDKGADRGRLILYIDDLQVGYRHEGDHDVLNQCDDEAIFQGRFLYQTVALPPMHTQGKTQVLLKIAGLGPMWPYGVNFAQKQKNLTEPTRCIYRAYTHTNTRFDPDPLEKQGVYVKPDIRPGGPGEELLTQMKETVNARLTRLMEDKSATGGDRKDSEGRILLLAEAYNRPWTTAYHNPDAIAALVRTGDEFLRPGVIGRSWIGAGPLGEAIMRIEAQPLQKALEEKVEVSENFPFAPDWRRKEPLEEPNIKELGTSGKTVGMKRREAWSRVLLSSIDWNRINGRRFYTNQSMIVDLNIYTANRGLMMIDPDRALPEKQVLRYVYEAIGLEPWLGNDTPEGQSTKPYGANYYQITRKGLNRELGYVGTYGETILKFCRDMAELTGDEKVRQQLVKIQNARMYFRYPSLDPDGYHVMKLASEIDNRTAHFPVGNGAYTSADVREAWWMEVPAFTKDPVSVGAAQQCLEDNQYFFRLAQRTKDNNTLGMMRNIDDYATTKALPKSSYRLPMTDGQPDFVFSDEENAVLAIKHGQDRLFLNFYYRQEFGVSGVVRILDVTPGIMRIATIKSQFEVVSSGQEWTRPDIIDFERSGGFPPPGKKIHQAWQGEKLPISKRPDDATRPQYGTWGPFVGKAAFYWLHYGDYLIGINTTQTHTYSLPVPSGITRATNLVSGKTLDLSNEVKVGPLATMVLYLGK